MILPHTVSASPVLLLGPIVLLAAKGDRRPDPALRTPA